MPTVIAAIVMVMMSRGIPHHPMSPSTAQAANRFGRIATIDNEILRKSTMNIRRMLTKTVPIVRICER